MFIGDALAMPVHWYYNTSQLRADYGMVGSYLNPRKIHPDSILWRSHFSPSHPSADILHDQKHYWGKKNVHYHQFLKAGENTLNLKLAHQLLLSLQPDGHYSSEKYLERMVVFLTTPGQHNDTYVEEYLRHFFINYGKGTPLHQCGRKDEKHIGGFALMLPLLIALHDRENIIELCLDHLALTHGGDTMKKWGIMICTLLLDLLKGKNLDEALETSTSVYGSVLKYQEFEKLIDYPDEIVVCRHFSFACYVDMAVPATLYLAVKYQASPEKGLIANTMCGGDNCGRGALLGAIFGSLHGEECWPQKWLAGLDGTIRSTLSQLKNC